MILKSNVQRIFPLFLLAVVIVAYGLFIPWLGFYLDDWYIVWFRHFFGSAAFTDFFAQDRPFLAWIYVILTPLLGDSPIAWQTFAVLTRWVLGMALWDLLQQVWPNHKFEASLGALIFSVFPGFQFHWFSVQYSQVYLIEAGMLISLACSVRAPRQPAHWLRWTLIGLLPGIYALISVEYHFGLELLRPVVIWLALTGQSWRSLRRLGRAAFLWLPYLIPLITFTIWRVFFFESFMYKVTLLEDIAASPLAALWTKILAVLQQLFEGLLVVWGRLFNLAGFSVVGKALIAVTLITLVSFPVILVYLSLAEKRQAWQPAIRSRLRWGLAAMLLGLFTAVLTLIPFLAAGLPVGLAYPWNRFMIVLGLGSSVFAVGALSLLPKVWLRSVAASVLISLSIASQIDTANQFRLAWAEQQKMFWQLSWRIPGLEPNTMLVTDTLHFAKFFSGTSLSAPLNWIYDPNLSSSDTLYQFILTDSPQINSEHSLPENQAYNFEFRSFRFSGNTSRSVLFLFNTVDCVQVLSDSSNNRRTIIGSHHSGFLNGFDLSDLRLIVADPLTPASPPAHLFGIEPNHGWCYYYQKADLARQIGDWEGVLRWYSLAQNQGLSELHKSELYPKIEAMVMTDDWQAAYDLTRELQGSDKLVDRGLCAIWERSAENHPPTGPDALLAQELVGILNCPDLEEILR